MQQILGGVFLPRQTLTQRIVDASLVGPVAPQVQALAGQHQGPLLHVLALVRGQGNQAAGCQHLAPMGAIQGFQQLRRQQHRATLQVAFRRQRQGEVRLLERLEQVQADMPVPQLVTGQCRRQQHQRVIGRCQLVKKADEGLVQCAQPATLDPAREQQQQVFGTTQRAELRQALGSQRRRQHIGEGTVHSSTPCSQAGSTLGCGLPWNRRSSCSINARGGRAKYTPWLGARVPRRNRYNAPPTCRS
ncbi:hypothetical protein D3C73_1078700 [compost metagenome]